MNQSLSYSRARTFSECPAKYKSQYIDNVADSGSAPLIIGKIVHECCDQYVKFLVAEKSPCDYPAMDRIFNEVWRSDQTEGLSDLYREDAYQLCVTAREMLKFDSPHHIVGAELKLAVDANWQPTDYDGPKAFLRGRIDRLDLDDDLNAHVVDYKSGWRIDAIDKSPQVALYACLVKAHQPQVRSIKVSLCYFRHEKIKSKIIEEKDYAQAKEWITTINHRMERAAKAGSYPARPGQACRACPAFFTCPARTTTVKPVPPGDDATAFQMAERLILLDRERKDILESIGPWIDLNGPIEVGGMVLGFRIKNRLKFDVKAVAELLAARGLKPLDYLAVNTYAIKKLGRRDRKTAEDLKACAEDISTTELKLQLGGNDDED